MTDRYSVQLLTAAELQLALVERYPDTTHGAVPVVDYAAAVKAYRRHHDSTPQETPSAFAVHLQRHREAFSHGTSSA